MATPICATCNKPVDGRAVFAFGTGYHPACFWPNGVPANWLPPPSPLPKEPA